MNATNQPLWTIEELSAQAALALSADYTGQGNGRVRDVPDLRTIRYYTTLGLIDRPAAMRGRTALYGKRHLLQLVAIKQLQSRGKTLAELQQQLLGLTDQELARLAKVPAPVLGLEVATRLPAEEVVGNDPGQSVLEPRKEAFWTKAPTPVEKREPAAAGSEVVLQGAVLAEDVTLLFRPVRPLESDDIEAIRAVAGPLLKLLEKRNLL